MKQLLFLPLIFLTFVCNATNYYVSNSGSNLSKGTSSGTPWASIEKVNSFKFTPVDVVYFKRGDTFYGGIKVAVDIRAYGVGARPVITGFIKVPDWINVGGNVWESKSAVSTLNTCNMVIVNGEFAAIGRYPNANEEKGGFLTYNTTAKNTVVKCVELAGNNWTGADVVMKVERYIISRRKIVAQNGVDITFNPIFIYKPKNNFGLFIQNDARTLDKNNEWYFNPITKKLKIFSSTQPVNVQLSTIDTLVRVVANKISINDIEFTGSNNETIAKPNKNGYNNISIKNCLLKFNGCNAINFKTGNNLHLLIDNCDIVNTNSNGIILGAGCANATITNNKLQNTGTVAGMSKDSLGNYWGISTGGKGTLIEKNSVINTGYVAISFSQNNTIIRNNYIDSFSQVLDDGGGIYTFTGSSNRNYSGRKIVGNIIMNGIGVRYGASVITSSSMAAEGIYLDDNSSGVEISGNTIINCVKSGILLHNARNIVIKNNTLYNNNFGLALSHDYNGNAITGNSITDNFFIAKDSKNFPASFFSIANDYSKIGTVDNNIYTRPVSDSATIKMEYPNLGWGYKTLAFWQAYSGKDLRSKKSFRSILNVNELDFQYNASPNARIYNFTGRSKKDLSGNVYQNSIIIPAWGSKVLLSNNEGSIANKSPLANAGINATIILPTSTVILRGSGTDSDGTVVKYSWVKLSGTASLKIISPDRSISTVTNLAQGVSMFALTVTDNEGGIGKDTVQVFVRAGIATNEAPVAIAGNNIILKLPINSTTLSGKGTDTDGTIMIYEWRKITGPANEIIVTPNKAATSINNLKQGVYLFELAVYDNKGATGKDTIEIRVNAPIRINIKPVANAGFDASVTSPLTTTTVSGTGRDIDGTISGYRWVKISGPEQGKIVKPFAASSSINGLIPGVYRLQFSVRDNDGDIDSDTIEITVNLPTANLLPAVNPTNIINGLQYKYYEGVWNFMPDFNALASVKSGTTNNFDINLANRSRDMGFNFYGYIEIPADGFYTFFTTSDDGSFLYIDDVMVVSNDGKHAAIEKSGIIGLKAGKHFIRAQYFQGPSGMSFFVSYQSANLAKQKIPETALFRSNNSTAGKPTGVKGNNKIMPFNTEKPLSVNCFPNPTTTDFTVNITGGTNEKVEIEVVNTIGQIIYSNGGTSNKNYNFGSGFKPGFYVIRVVQGKSLQIIKAIKQL